MQSDAVPLQSERFGSILGRGARTERSRGTFRFNENPLLNGGYQCLETDVPLSFAVRCFSDAQVYGFAQVRIL